jgi:hypothetical protein
MPKGLGGGSNPPGAIFFLIIWVADPPGIIYFNTIYNIWNILSMGDRMGEGWSWFNLLKGNETESRAVIFGIINGMVGLLLGAYYTQLHYIFGMAIVVIAVFSFVGTALVMMRKYAPGAILMGISGVAFIPIGIIGIVGAMIAWHHSPGYRKKHKSLRKSRMSRKG